MVRPIVKYGDSVLGKVAQEITGFDSTLRSLADEMFEIMYAARGVGLAAPQIGVSSRIFVMDTTGGQETARKVVVINPVIEVAEGEQQDAEGCLSVPGFSFDIRRPGHVIVRGQDVNGSDIRLDVTGLEARCVSHEIDHLNGRLLLSHVSPLKRDLTIRKIKKRIKADDW
jgi:peptide deformylase